MNKKQTKLFIDIEEEIQWLNEMSELGWKLVNKSFITYEFESCLSCEYLYQIELTINKIDVKSKQDYFDFLKETGIELVCISLGWSYYRRNFGDKQFMIFSDYPSIIKHYIRISYFFISIFIINISIIHRTIKEGLGPYFFNISIPQISNLICGSIMLVGMITYYLKIRNLKKLI